MTHGAPVRYEGEFKIGTKLSLTCAIEMTDDEIEDGPEALLGEIPTR